MVNARGGTKVVSLVFFIKNKEKSKKWLPL